jgi:hypothetical protein
LSSTHYTNLAWGHGQGVSLIGTQAIIHPNATVPAARPPTSCGHFLQGSTAISSYLSSDPGPAESQYAEVYTPFPGQCDPQVKRHPISNLTGLFIVVMQMAPGSMLGNTQPPCTTPSLMKDGVANIKSKVSAPKRSAHDVDRLCPICSVPLGRSQDRKRHILSHLPHWLYCPDPGCSWRGDRWETLNKHRRMVHPSKSQESDKNIVIIYDPRPLVQGIIQGAIPIEDAKAFAISMVEGKALELGKSGLWGDLWGRKRTRRKL